MNLSRSLLLLFLLPVILTGSQVNGVLLVEEFTVGGAQASEEAFLAQPAAVGEANGHLFVADLQLSAVKVYDRSGNYLRQFGRRGKGPGEFGVLYDMHVNGEEIVTMDDQLMRFIKFSPEGEVISTHFYSDLGLLVSPRDMTRLDNGNYLMVYGTGANRPSDEDFKRSVLHEVTPELDEVVASFGTRGEIYGAYEGYADFSNADPGNVTRAGNRVVFVPRLYAGELFVYEREGDTWTHIRTLENPDIAGAPFELLSSGSERDPDANFSSIGSDGNRQNFYLRQFSRDIAIISDTLLVHMVSADWEGEEKRDMLEVYDLNRGERLFFGEPDVEARGGADSDFSFSDMGPQSGVVLTGSGHLYRMVLGEVASVTRYRLELIK